MVIYIYGTKSFVDEVHSIFNRSNIKLKLGDSDIVEIKSLSRLKNEIEQNPKQIFLIDEDKIIKRDSLNEKLNIFKAKDRIEEEFLQEHGIGDLDVDKFDDITKYVLKKLEEEEEQSALKEQNINDISEDEIEELKSLEYLHEDELSDISCNSLIKENSLKREYNNSLHDEDFDLVVEEIKETKKIEEVKKVSKIEKLQEVAEEIKINKIEKLQVEKILEKGNITMDNKFFELDSLSENDLMNALNDNSSKSKAEQIVVLPKQNAIQQIELNSNNSEDVSKLLLELFNNKTLEITVKIKE